MRIGLNLLHAHPDIGGGWDYIKSIVDALKSDESNNEYFAYCTPKSVSLVQDAKRFTLRVLGISGANRLTRILCEQLFLPTRAAADGVDLIHWFSGKDALYSRVGSVVTIHDLLPFVHPQHYDPARRWYARYMVARLARGKAILTPVSETTAGQVRASLGVKDDRIVVVPFAIGGRLHPAPLDIVEDFRRLHGLPVRFWLYVAHFYPHKNHERLLHAYAMYRRQNNMAWPLVLRGDSKGRQSQLMELCRSLGIAAHVQWLPRIPDDKMSALYSAAAGLVFPSLFEGCGIPVLEAMACGCPVLASDLPTTSEFAGTAAIRFDPQSTEAMLSAMVRFAGDEDLRRSCRTIGLQQAERFSPSATVVRLHDAYSRVVSRN